MQSEINPWDRRLVGESAKAFHAFTVYRDMSFERGIQKVAKELSRSRQLMQRWAAKHRWQTRAQAWDVYEDQVRQSELIKQRTKFHKATLLTAERMLDVAAEGLNALKPVRTVKHGGKEILEPALQPIDLVRLADAAWKLQQNVLGRSDKDQVAQIVVQFGNTEDYEDEDAEDMEATQSN